MKDIESQGKDVRVLTLLRWEGVQRAFEAGGDLGDDNPRLALEALRAPINQGDDGAGVRVTVLIVLDLKRKIN